MSPYLEINLRDWFAGQALNAILNHEKNIICVARNQGGPEQIAEQAYCMAEAMLGEREKRAMLRESDKRLEIGF